MAYNYGINKYGGYELPLNESSGDNDSQYNDEGGYARGFTGESQNPNPNMNQYVMGADNGANYNYAYGDDAGSQPMYSDEPEPPAQDIYSAAYEGMGQQNAYADPNEEDPYAGINIDYEKIEKATQKQKLKQKAELLRAKDKPEAKSSEEPSSAEENKSEDKLPIELEKDELQKELERDSVSDIDKARVEEDSDKPDDSAEVSGSHEKIVNFQDLKKMYDDKEAESSQRPADALALANNQESSEDDNVPMKPAADSNSQDHSQMEDDSSRKQNAKDIVKTAQQPKGKADAHEVKKKDVTPPNNKGRLDSHGDPVSGGDTYSYEDDFEQSSVRGTNRDKEVPPQTKVDEKPGEEGSDKESSGHETKMMTWADFKKSDAEINQKLADFPVELKPEPNEIAHKEPVQPSIVVRPETSVVTAIRDEPRVVMEVVKKIRIDDQAVQTDIGPVQFADKSARECLLEATVMEEKKRGKQLQVAIEEKEASMGRLQENLKKIELDCIAAQKQAATAGETVKRLMSENKEVAHNSNMLKIEKEDLIRKGEELSHRLQDAEKDKLSMREECEKKVKIAEERAEQRSQKLETRALDDLQRTTGLEKSILQKQIEDKDEELSYYKEKCTKFEAENTSLKLTNKAKVDADTKIRELQQENYVLQVKLGEAAGKKEPAAAAEVKTDETLRKEIETQEILIKGYQRENENMTDEIRQLKLRMKEMEGLMYKENVRMREEQNKIVRENDKVMIVEDSSNVGVDVWNKLGKSNVVSTGEIKSIKLQMDMLQMDKKRLEEQVKKGELQSKSEVAMLLQQKQELEAKFGMSYEDIQRDRKDKVRLESELDEARKKHVAEVEELRGRIKWLVDNQELVEKNVQLLREKDAEIARLKQSAGTSVVRSESKKQTTHSKTSALLSKTTKAAPTKGKVRFSDEELQRRVNELERQLKDTETGYESKLRTLQQQYEKVKTRYEAANGGNRGMEKMEPELYEGRIRALEQEKDDIKQFYIGKIKEYEQKENANTLNSAGGALARLSRSDPNMESFTKPLKRLLVSPEGSMIAKIYAETEKLRLAVQQHRQEEVTQHMDEITHAFEKSAAREVTGKQADMITRLIDKIMALGNNVTAGVVNNEGETVKMIEDIQSVMLGEAEKYANASKEKAANRYKAQGDEAETKEAVIDFADSNFDVETKETSSVAGTLAELQKWIAGGCKLSIEFVQNYYDPTHLGRVSAQDLISAFTAAGFEAGIDRLYLLVRRLGIEADGKLDYVILLDNLRSKDVAWWSDFLKKAATEPKAGTVAKVPAVLLPFTQATLIAKLKAALNKSFPADALTKMPQFAEAKSELSKSELRRLLIDTRVPLNREDMAVLFHMLSDKRGQTVSKRVLADFLQCPERKVQKPMAKEAWNETTAMRQQPSLDECYKKIAGQVVREKIDLDGEFRLLDQDSTGMVSFETLLNVCEAAGLSLTTTEIRAIFESLQYKGDGNRIDYSDFVQNIMLNSRSDDLPQTTLMKTRLAQCEHENTELKQAMRQSLAGGKWEEKARTLHGKCKELAGMCDSLGKAKRDLEYKIETIVKDPKQRQILELQKKIESLETVVKERDAYIRKTLGTAENMETTAVRKNAELEKAELMQVILNKNKEVAMFKSELDSVLTAMERLRKKKAN